MHTVLLAALCLAGCAASSAPPAAPLSGRAPVDPRAAQPQAASVDDAVRLAVFRYQMGHNASGAQAGAPFVCLEVHQGEEARDPSPFIMTALSGGGTQVVPGSACEHSSQGVFLKGNAAKGRGLVFRTEKVKIDGDKATVSGGYFEAGLSASGNVYTVERQSDGSWLVTKDEMQWIS
jgi:hypothetical protein